MIKTLKHKLFYYKLHNIDIWGLFRNSFNNRIVKIRKYKKKYRRQFICYWEKLILTKINIDYDSSKGFDLLNLLLNLKKKFIKLDYLLFIVFLNYILLLIKRRLMFKNLMKFGKIQKLKKNFKILSSNYFKRKFKLFFNFSADVFKFPVWNKLNKQKKKIFYFSKKFLNFRFYLYKLFLKKKDLYKSRRGSYYFTLNQKTYWLKKKKRNKRFMSLRLIKLYYITLTFRHFKKIALKAKRTQGFFESNYLNLMENRLLWFIYRTNLMYNIFEIIKFIKNGCVWINKEYVQYPNIIVTLGSLVGFNTVYKGYIYWVLVKRVKTKKILFLPAYYIFVSHIFLCAFLKKMPRLKDLIFPIKNFNIHRVLSYAV